LTHIFLFLVLDRTYVWMVGTGFGIAAMLLFARGGNFILSGVVNSLQLPGLDFGTRGFLFVVCLFVMSKEGDRGGIYRWGGQE